MFSRGTSIVINGSGQNMSKPQCFKPRSHTSGTVYIPRPSKCLLWCVIRNMLLTTVWSESDTFTISMNIFRTNLSGISETVFYRKDLSLSSPFTLYELLQSCDHFHVSWCDRCGGTKACVDTHFEDAVWFMYNGWCASISRRGSVLDVLAWHSEKSKHCSN